MSDLLAIMDLFQAVKQNDIDQVRKLIASGIDVNMKNGSGQTPLHLASVYNRKAVAELLIKAGVGINVKDQGGETALHLAAVYYSMDVLKLLKKAGAGE
jgi:serine/threonine-protein phosphatase 6 regulatory ankyrin repeat subunit B